MTNILSKAVISLGTKLLATIASEVLLEWAFFKLAEAVTKSTKTKHDDEFLAKVKEIYEQGK